MMDNVNYSFYGLLGMFVNEKLFFYAFVQGIFFAVTYVFKACFD
jgi:hypothetical protein